MEKKISIFSSPNKNLIFFFLSWLLPFTNFTFHLLILPITKLSCFLFQCWCYQYCSCIGIENIFSVKYDVVYVLGGFFLVNGSPNWWWNKYGRKLRANVTCAIPNCLNFIHDVGSGKWIMFILGVWVDPIISIIYCRLVNRVMHPNPIGPVKGKRSNEKREKNEDFVVFEISQIKF